MEGLNYKYYFNMSNVKSFGINNIKDRFSEIHNYHMTHVFIFLLFIIQKHIACLDGYQKNECLIYIIVITEVLS